MTYVIQSIIPRGEKVMNVFNIQKQCDEKLIYSNHAIE